MPKTCIVYPEMDQTVGKYQEHSRTVKKQFLQIQEIKKEAQNQETKPTIRSETQRQVRIYSLF